MFEAIHGTYNFVRLIKLNFLSVDSIFANSMSLVATIDGKSIEMQLISLKKSIRVSELYHTLLTNCCDWNFIKSERNSSDFTAVLQVVDDDFYNDIIVIIRIPREENGRDDWNAL